MKTPSIMRFPGIQSRRGFTLVEMMITLAVLAVAVIAIASVVYTASRSKTSTANNIESAQTARIAADLIAKDLRSAGYGADMDYPGAPQHPIQYVDSTQVILCENLSPWPDSTLAGTNRIYKAPLAYSPTANPKPFPLVATEWQPPVRYRTGAELIRWTLDLNNDGAVNNSDLADANGIDAQRTPNPSDFTLVRQVYGDSTGNVAGYNGGQVERVALVALPTSGTVPPLFSVYMNGSVDPWNWSDGPVPASQLGNISRIKVNVTAPSPKPDYRGRYMTTTFTTDVGAMRNVPNFGAPTFDLDGYVFMDRNQNGSRNGGDPGIQGAAVHLGMYSVTTDVNGYFNFRVPGGTYTLRHSPPIGYGTFTSPDSFVVTLGPDATRSFADTAAAGGQVTCNAFRDLNSNAALDTGEPGIGSVSMTMSGTNQTAYTATNGSTVLFAPVGSYNVSCTPPDSFVVLSANPVSGTMSKGGSASFDFALSTAQFGKVTGTVYRDVNRNGYRDGGESGIANVWVGVSADGGVTVPGYDYTNASGAFSINVPSNDPPHTTPYSVFCIPPAGFYPTSAASIGSLWVQSGQTYSGRDFGMSTFQLITLNATRVLSLASGDLIEKDWPSTTTALAHADADIVLGADAAGVDQVSAWTNQYNSTPLFTASPTYTRSAPQSVLSMALDSLDGSSPKGRLDLITGTKYTTSGNFFVWFNQNTSGNEGYFPSAYSTGQNYKTLDLGDVQAVLTYDCAGTSSADYPDIIVGTKSPTAGKGTVELWKCNNASTPAWTREDVYPTAGGTPAGFIGEVTSMALADFDGDGKKDLAVGTTTSGTSGQVVFFRFANKASAPHFTYMTSVTLPYDAVTALSVVDLNGDGTKDVIVGTQRSSSSGKLIYLQNMSGLSFLVTQTVDAPGIVTSLIAADFGGTNASDIAVGFRQNTTSYVGGIRIYYLDTRAIPGSGTDPSGGFVVNMVAALTANDFNYGWNPTPASPYLTDVAAGVKSSATTGALVVFVR